MLSRAIDNLLANVRAHTPEGTAATVTAYGDGSGKVVIEVSDDGPGVAAAHEGTAHAMLEHPHGLSVTLRLPAQVSQVATDVR